MRSIKIGIAAVALGFGGLAFAQMGPNPNLPGGGANVPPPTAAGGTSGMPLGSTVAPTPLGQGNVPSTSTNNLGSSTFGANNLGSNVGSSSGPGTSTSGDINGSTGNVPSTTLNVPSTTGGVPSTLNPPSSVTLNPPPSTTLNPPASTLNNPTNTLTPPLTQPNTLGVPGSSQPGGMGPGTVGGLPTTNP